MPDVDDNALCSTTVPISPNRPGNTTSYTVFVSDAAPALIVEAVSTEIEEFIALD